MAQQNHSARALGIIRSRICNQNHVWRHFCHDADGNYSKLKFLLSSSVTEACNNSILLLGPRGCGKTAVLELVLTDLSNEFSDMISVIRLNGLLHTDDNSALKEISRQLCLEHQLSFSKAASFDDNSQFVIAMLRECRLALKTIIFVLDEFDLFAQGKQRLLYSLLDALQSVTSQSVVIGISCRLDVDQILEKRVRSRFSYRKLLFLPLSYEQLGRLSEYILCLPADSKLPQNYVSEFNTRMHALLADQRFKDVIMTLASFDSSPSHLFRFLFRAVCFMDSDSGFLSFENFQDALSCVQRQPKIECLKDLSIVELYILVCMKRLEVKENLCNFVSIMQEYKVIHDSFQTSDYYSRPVCFRAFEHLIQRELICFGDSRGRNSVECRPVKLLISSHELYQGLKSNRFSPAILMKLIDRKA